VTLSKIFVLFIFEAWYNGLEKQGGHYMFQNNQLSVLDWFVFHVLLAIPIVNVIIIILLLLNPETNETLKNLILFYLIMFAVGIVLWLVVFMGLMGMMGMMG